MCLHIYVHTHILYTYIYTHEYMFIPTFICVNTCLFLSPSVLHLFLCVHVYTYAYRHTTSTHII